MATNCERCGASLPEGALFCPRCGTAVAEAAQDEATFRLGASEELGRATERKVVTVLFADLAASTQLAATLDPERYREVVTSFYSMVSRELSQLRGQAEKFAGDAVMAVFGLPHAHDDDALRAIRAGLIIRDRTAKLGEDLGLAVRLRVRVGVNSGPVAAGPGPGEQLMVSGAAVNLAARLQQGAAPDEVLVGDTTMQLARAAVAFGEPREVAARGFADPVTAWPVLSLSARSSRRTIPIVGRDRELALLADTFERVRKASRAHLVTILGEPGIGKSRLVEELVARVPEEAIVLTGRASELEEEVTYAPLAQVVRRQVGVERDAPISELRARLRDVVDGCCEPGETEVVAARLGLVLGLAEDRGGDPSDPEGEPRDAGSRGRFRAAEIRQGFLAFLEGLSRRGPLLLVLEDVHAARPAMLDLVEEVLRGARRMPLLVVVAARDSLLEERPGWGSGHPDSVTLRLEPLEPDEARELAIEAGGDIDEATARRIAEHAGGNPFFIVETTGMILQQHPEHVLGTPHSHLLPPTVQAVVASRIDHLPPEARDVLRKASVFSTSTFDVRELELVTGPADEALRVLEEAEILVRDPDRPRVWRFRHEVVRDVAYESLPKRERSRLHSRVADGIVERGEAERYSQSLAYHLEQAARAALDLNPGDRGLADRAVDALSRAADLARWRMESRTAIDLYERSLALAGPEDSWGSREAHALVGIGEAQYWLGGFESSESTLERSLEVEGRDPWIRAHAKRFLADIALNVHGDADRAGVLFDDALAAARLLRRPWALARTLLMAGWLPYWRGDLGSARAMFEEALAAARSNPERDEWGEARALTSLTSVISPEGDEAECLQLAEQALRLGRELRDPFTVAVAQQTMGNSLRIMWRLDEALAGLEDAVTTFRELGARWEVASALGDRGQVNRLLGRYDEAEADLRETLRISRQLGDRALVPFNLLRLVRVLLAKGERAEAERLVAEAGSSPVFDDPAVYELVEAESFIAYSEGDGDRARAKAMEVLDTVRKIGHRNDEAAMTWLVGSVFGPEAAGGDEALAGAGATLESAHWFQMIREPHLPPFGG